MFSTLHSVWLDIIEHIAQLTHAQCTLDSFNFNLQIVEITRSSVIIILAFVSIYTKQT